MPFPSAMMMRLLVFVLSLCVACHHTAPCTVNRVIFVLQFVLPAVVSSLPLVAVPCISCIFSWYAGRLLAKSRDGVVHGRLVRRQSGERSPRSGLHVLGSGAPHHTPASKSFAHQRAEDLRRSERSAVNEEALVQEHLGAYRCLSDDYPQQIVPWCPSSRSGAHVRRRTPRGRPRGTAWRTATRQPVVLGVDRSGIHRAHTRASTLAPGAGHGVCMVSRLMMAPCATPGKNCGQARSDTAAPDGVVSLSRCAPSVHAPCAWRMTSAPLPVRPGKRPRRAAPRRPSMA